MPKAIKIEPVIKETWLTPHFEGNIMFFQKNKEGQTHFGSVLQTSAVFQ